MRPLNSPDVALPRMDVVPAKLHDLSGSVYDDRLYTLYTTSTTLGDSGANISIIASDLVKHTAKNNQTAYWVGVGIHHELLDGSST